jgi:hypothetical protein
MWWSVAPLESQTDLTVAMCRTPRPPIFGSWTPGPPFTLGLDIDLLKKQNGLTINKSEVF